LPLDEFEVVIGKPDRAEPYHRREDQPHIRFRNVSPQQRGEDHRKENENPAHRGGPALHQMTLGPVIADLLAQLDFLQLADEPRGQNKRDEKCRDRRINDAEALIAKNVQEREFGVEWIQPIIQHKTTVIPTPEACSAESVSAPE
jgi:hypothetical protein